MRIVAGLPAYPPSSRVGAWLTTHEFLTALVRAGHHVDVVPSLAPADQYAYVFDGVAVHPGAHLERLAAGADVIVSHLGDDQMATLLAHRIDVPSVRMVHGIPGRAHVLDDDLVVFNSASLAAEVAWPGRQIVAHPPVAVNDYRTAPGDHVTLVNLSRPKGATILWDLCQRLPDVQFLAVRGSYGAQVVRTAPNVTVIDPTIDMPADVYSRTRILLMPSQHETWGRTGIEAACSGIPTIASPTPGLLESLAGAGTFVERRDLPGWERAIRRLLEPAAWAEASGRALARAAELDPAPDLARFVAAVEALVPAKAAA